MTQFNEKWQQVSHDLDACYALIKNDKHHHRQLTQKELETIKHYLNHNEAVIQAIRMIINRMEVIYMQYVNICFVQKRYTSKTQDHSFTGYYYLHSIPIQDVQLIDKYRKDMLYLNVYQIYPEIQVFNDSTPKLRPGENIEASYAELTQCETIDDFIQRTITRR